MEGEKHDCAFSTVGLESKRCLYGGERLFLLTSCDTDSRLLPGMPLQALNRFFPRRCGDSEERFMGTSGCAILIKIKPLEWIINWESPTKIAGDTLNQAMHS